MSPSSRAMASSLVLFRVFDEDEDPVGVKEEEDAAGAKVKFSGARLTDCLAIASWARDFALDVLSYSAAQHGTTYCSGNYRDQTLWKADACLEIR